MLNTTAATCPKVPSANEEEYCHFCFSSTNLNHLLPLDQFIRPDVLSFIDSFIGVPLTPKTDSRFTLCKRCIDTIEYCITFRDCCRKHHEAVRETRHFNRALEHFHSFLQESVLDDPPTPNLNHESNYVPLDGSNAVQQEVTLCNTNQTATPTVDRNRAKRRTEISFSLNFAVPSKRMLIQNEERSYAKGNHIRVLMRRASVKFRHEVNSDTSSGACLETPNETATFASDEMDINQSTRNIVNTALSNRPKMCQPCLVVVKKLDINV